MNNNIIYIQFGEKLFRELENTSQLDNICKPYVSKKLGLKYIRNLQKKNQRETNTSTPSSAKDMSRHFLGQVDWMVDHDL